MQLNVILSEKSSAASLMAKDEQGLEALSQNSNNILHFYSWEQNAATYGYFANPFLLLSEEGIKKWQVQLAKRPTGGGIIFHHCDLAFSILLSSSHPAFSLNTLANYALINNCVIEAITRFSGSQSFPTLLKNEAIPLDQQCQCFCMAKPTKYDVMIAGKKVGGGAQRRTKHGLLHQGSIALSLPSDDFLQDVLGSPAAIQTAMYRNSYPLLGLNCSEWDLKEGRREMQSILENIFKERFCG